MEFLTVVARLAAAPPVSDTLARPSFWHDFLTSAGFGGLMAVLAAAIAAGIAYVQFRHARQREATDRWWVILTWVYDRTMVKAGERSPLPHTVTLSMISALNDQAKRFDTDRADGVNGIESESIAAIVGMFTTTESDTPEPTDSASLTQQPTAESSIVVTDHKAAALLDHLVQDVARRGLAYTSPRDKWHTAAIEALVSANPGLGCDLTAMADDHSSCDFAVAQSGRTVLVRTYYQSGPVRTPGATSPDGLREMAAQVDSAAADNVFVISNRQLAPLTLKIMNISGAHITCVRWRDERDDRHLAQMWSAWFGPETEPAAT